MHILKSGLTLGDDAGNLRAFSFWY